jgi:hypothetical protein
VTRPRGYDLSASRVWRCGNRLWRCAGNEGEVRCGDVLESVLRGGSTRRRLYSAGHFASQAVLRCNHMFFKRRGFQGRSCLHWFSLADCSLGLWIARSTRLIDLHVGMVSKVLFFCARAMVRSSSSASPQHRRIFPQSHHSIGRTADKHFQFTFEHPPLVH